MKNYNIGLDFGTYQTKVCILDIDNDTHEFFRFPSNNSFFLPSKVSLTANGNFEYGITNNNSKKYFYYFKIASAEDIEFRLESFKTDTNNLYNAEEFAPFTPEFLSVAYLTFVIFTIKEVLKCRQPSEKATGLLGRLLTQAAEKETISFSIQLGIPTEWSQIKNLRRK